MASHWIRPGHFELAVEQIRCYRNSVAGIGRAAEIAPIPTNGEAIPK
jgi:hypothetical protein